MRSDPSSPPVPPPPDWPVLPPPPPPTPPPPASVPPAPAPADCAPACPPVVRTTSNVSSRPLEQPEMSAAAQQATIRSSVVTPQISTVRSPAQSRSGARLKRRRGGSELFSAFTREALRLRSRKGRESALAGAKYAWTFPPASHA